MYQKIGPAEARRVLANLFPSGSVKSMIENRLAVLKEQKGMIEEAAELGIIDQLVDEILNAYSKNPDVKSLSQ